MKEEVFTVVFACGNCGKGWPETFQRGDRVEGTYLVAANCTGSLSCKACRRVYCPLCNIEKDVRVQERYPGPPKEANVMVPGEGA